MIKQCFKPWPQHKCNMWLRKSIWKPVFRSRSLCLCRLVCVWIGLLSVILRHSPKHFHASQSHSQICSQVILLWAKNYAVLQKNDWQETQKNQNKHWSCFSVLVMGMDLDTELVTLLQDRYAKAIGYKALKCLTGRLHTTNQADQAVFSLQRK